MRTQDFLSRLDHDRIVAAIAAAERTTSGEIRVFVQRGGISGDVVAAAERKFLELGMQHTAERNAILIFVAPRVQKFAVVGDQGVYQKCGAEFWEHLVAAMRAHFTKAEFTEALTEAIDEAGQLLARYFPRQHDDRDELSNKVIEE